MVTLNTTSIPPSEGNKTIESSALPSKAKTTDFATMLFKAAEAREATNVFRRIFNWVLTHIRQREGSDFRISLMVSANELINIKKRKNNRTDPPLVQLYGITPNHPNVTTLSKPLFLPIQPLEAFLNLPTHLPLIFQNIQGLLNQLREYAAKLNNAADRNFIIRSIDNFEKKVSELKANQNDSTITELKYTFEAFSREITRRDYSDKAINDDTTQALTETRIELQTEFSKANYGSHIKKRIEPLISKDETIQILRSFLLTVSEPVDSSGISTSQQVVIDNLLQLISKVSQIPGSFVSTKFISEIIDEKFPVTSSGKDFKDKLMSRLAKIPRYFSTEELSPFIISDIKDLIKRAFPRENFTNFAFKSDLESQRELLMRALIEDLGELGRVITPKFDLTLRDCTLDNVSSPVGIASEWIGDKNFSSITLILYHNRRKMLSQIEHFERVVSRKSSVEQDLKELDADIQTLKQNQSVPSTISPKFLDRLKISAEKSEIPKMESQLNSKHVDLKKELNLILHAEDDLKQLPKKADLLNLLSINEKELSDAASSESINLLGFLDVVFTAFDSHIRQLYRDRNGAFQNIDFARFLLPYPIYSSIEGIHCLRRSCCLDHPFASKPMSKDMAEKILALNPDDIVDKWRKKDLIKDEAFFDERAKNIADLKNVLKCDPVYSFDKLNQLNVWHFIPDEDPQALLNKLNAQLGTSHDGNMGDKISQLKRGQQFVKEAKSYAIRHFRSLIRKIEQEKLAAIQFLGPTADAASRENSIKEIEQFHNARIVVHQDTITQIQQTVTFKQLTYLCPAKVIKKIIEAKIEKEKRMRISKLDERAANEFSDNLKKFQRYLDASIKAGRIPSLRETAENAVYPYLKPFLDAVERISGNPYEKLAAGIDINNQPYYRSITQIWNSILSTYRHLFTTEELENLRLAYDAISNEKISKIGKKEQNLAAVSFL